MDAYGLYKLLFKARLENKQTIFLTPWRCIPLKKLDLTANLEQKTLIFRHHTMES